MVSEYAEEQRYAFLGPVSVEFERDERPRDRPFPAAQRRGGRLPYRPTGRAPRRRRQPRRRPMPHGSRWARTTYTLRSSTTRIGRGTDSRPAHRRSRHLAPPRRDPPAGWRRGHRRPGSTNGIVIDEAARRAGAAASTATDRSSAARPWSSTRGRDESDVRAHAHDHPARFSGGALAVRDHCRLGHALRSVRATRGSADERQAASAPAARPPKPSKPVKPAKGKRGMPSMLVVTQGALSGTSIRLGEAPVTMGRSQDSTIVLDDDYVSSRHARIFPQDGQWYVEDMGSTNGTYLDRTKVTSPTPVKIGVPIRVGKTVSRAAEVAGGRLTWPRAPLLPRAPTRTVARRQRGLRLCRSAAARRRRRRGRPRGRRGGVVGGGRPCSRRSTRKRRAATCCERLSTAVTNANTYLRDMVRGDPELRGMGTTVTAMLRAGSRFGLVHVGDSRCYLLRGGELQQITRDHTFVQGLIDEGRITPEEADHHPQRSVITNALDGAEHVEPDLSVREARVGDRYLLCSDGLSGVVSEDTLRETLADNPVPEDAVERLVDLALRGGGPDNITAIVADVVDVDASPSAVPVVVGAAASGTNRRSEGSSAAAKAAALSPQLDEDDDFVDDERATHPVRRTLFLLAGAGVACRWGLRRVEVVAAAVLRRCTGRERGDLPRSQPGHRPVAHVQGLRRATDRAVRPAHVPARPRTGRHRRRQPHRRAAHRHHLAAPGRDLPSGGGERQRECERESAPAPAPLPATPRRRHPRPNRAAARARPAPRRRRPPAPTRRARPMTRRRRTVWVMAREDEEPAQRRAGHAGLLAPHSDGCLRVGRHRAGRRTPGRPGGLRRRARGAVPHRPSRVAKAGSGR